MITAEVARQLLDYNPDTGKLIWKERDASWFSDGKRYSAEQNMKRWNRSFSGKEAFTCSMRSGYKQGSILGKLFMAHRVIWLMHYGYLPYHIDHINGQEDDNRICNLREVNEVVNGRNRRMSVRNKSGFNGVTWNKTKKKWESYIRYQGKKIGLGYYCDFEKAVTARKLANAKYGYSDRHGTEAPRA